MQANNEIQTVFYLNDEDWDRLMEILERPPKANENLKKLFKKKPLWEMNDEDKSGQDN